jgi:hypothetical protein
MKTKHAILMLVPAVIFVYVVGSIGVGYYLHTLPSWQLSVERKDDGSIITVYKEKSEEPTYKVIVKGWRVKQPFHRLLRTEIASDSEIKTIRWDDNLPPGDWLIEVAGARLDIMPARLIVNASTEYEPGETVTIEGSLPTEK